MLLKQPFKSKSNVPLKTFQSAAKWLRPTLLVIFVSFLAGCESLAPVKQTTVCVATEPVLNDLISFSGVDLAVVDSRNNTVVYQQTVPESTSLTFLTESDLAELAVYIEQLRQCVNNL